MTEQPLSIAFEKNGDWNISKITLEVTGHDHTKYLTILPDGTVTGAIIDEYPEALAAFQKLGRVIEGIYDLSNPKEVNGTDNPI